LPYCGLRPECPEITGDFFGNKRLAAPFGSKVKFSDGSEEQIKARGGLCHLIANQHRNSIKNAIIITSDEGKRQKKLIFGMTVSVRFGVKKSE